MTKFQKKMLTIAAAGALSAVTALPAMAFENEFHGLFNFNTVFSNYNRSAGGVNLDPTAIDHKSKMNNYFEQRLRIQYTAKASDDLKLVTHFEVNSNWGNSSKQAATNGRSGGLDADAINLVTKWAYLDFNIGKNFNTKVGIQPYKDTLKGIYIDADLPMVRTTTKLGNYTLGVGYGRYHDEFYVAGGPARVGDQNTDLFVLDNTYAFSKDTKATFSYYLNADYSTANQAQLLNTFGLGGQTKLAGIDLSGFVAMQAGHEKQLNASSKKYHGWAANIGAKTKIGPGVARLGGLFVSGDKNNNKHHGWQGVLNPNGLPVQSFNESGLIILTRNTANSPTQTDHYLRREITNQALLYAGYNAQLTEKFNLDGGVGFAWVPSSEADNKNVQNYGTGKRNASDFMGTEIGLTAGYQLYKNLKLQAQGAYMINGGYYKNTVADNNGALKTPDNPYTMRLQARYSF